MATIIEFEPLLMMECLLSLTRSLRQLRLAMDRPLILEDNFSMNTRLGSLAGFKVLTHLFLPVEFLAGMAAGCAGVDHQANPWGPELWGLVPRSLEYLLISGLVKEVNLAFAQKEILELVRRKASVAPKLKSIVLVDISLDE
ncbi:hypothetical protein VE03_09787 [Pseudogymnoascus sp. 23342-1-I1]|nr:hypothetical protein VE03_09787 [Pseudogymnoascus sp. 23342-1-I1]